MARCFTVLPGTVREGIVLHQGEIVLGEEGRGRKRVSIAPPQGFEVVQESDWRLLTTVPSKELGALVCIRDQSGFRGGWRLHQPWTDADWDVFVGAEKRHKDENGVWSPGHVENRMQGPSGYLSWVLECPGCRGIIGADRAMQLEETLECPPEGIRVVAHGRCAQGDAGHMGGGPEYLLFIPEGGSVAIRRSGRTYGDPKSITITSRNGIVTASYPLSEARKRAASAALAGI